MSDSPLPREETTSFLSGDSGMAALIRAFDWSRTLGPIENWPASLKTTVGLMVHSPIAIVLLWGPDGIMIYNDAYARFAGRRHPQLLGSKVLEGWPEVADFNANIMKVGMAGGTLTYHDRELVLDRRGVMEQGWMDLGYSPVIAEDGRPGGVIAIVVETTERVLAQRHAASERDRLAQMFVQAPSFMALLEGPQHIFALSNPGYDRLVGGRPLLGRSVAQALPEIVEQGFLGILDQVYETGQPYSALGAHVDLHDPLVGGMRTCYLDFVYQPVADEAGRTTGIFVQGVDVTQRVLADRRRDVLIGLTDVLAGLDDAGEIVARAAEALGLSLAAGRVGYATIDAEAETVRIDRDWSAPGIEPLLGTFGFRDYGSFIDELKRGHTVVVADVRTDERTRAHLPALDALQVGSFINVPLIEQQRLVALLFVHDARPRAHAPEDVALAREVAARTRTAVERVRAARALRLADGRFQFLDELNRAVGGTQDADEILALTARMTGEYMNASVCAYADMDEDEDGFTIRGDWAAPGSSSIVGRYRLSEFGSLAVDRLRAGLPLVINDNLRELPAHEAATFQAIGLSATICMPLVRHGRLKALMAVHDRQPRTWTGGELALAREVTQRSWAHVERAAAEAEVRASNVALEQRVTERTSQLLDAQEALRQAQKMEAVGQLTGGLAHDFNNLLAAIGGSLALIKRGMPQDSPRLTRYMDTAEGAVRRAASLTHRLLAFSRRQALDPKPTDVNRLINGMEDLIRRSVGPSVSVEMVGAAGLWITRVDPSQLESALLNLCINARDAMAPEGGRLTIETANKWMDERTAHERDLAPGQYISLSVTDTGAGMTPEVIQRAFDPFFTTKPIGQGTGLGLSMVYGFVRQSGGHVRIHSEVGQGTTLCLYLPRFADSAEDPAPLAMPGACEAGSGETIVLIDDEPAIRMLVSDVLKEAGYVVLEAGTGAEGLRVLDLAKRVDLLITDVGLPGGMNGRQVADAARTTRPELKVLFITGYAANAAVGNGHLAPGMDIVTKPFEITELATKVRAILDRP